jgi:hypothetical protein
MSKRLTTFYQDLKPKLKRLGTTASTLYERLIKTLVLCGGRWIAPIWKGSKRYQYTSLTELPVKVLIHGIAYGSDLPNWDELQSEYYLVKEDTNAANFIRIVAKLKAIEFRARFTDYALNCMGLYYNADLAEELKKDFPRLKWTIDTYKSDIQAVINLEKNRKIEFNSLSEQLKQLKGNGKESTPDEIYKGLINAVFEVNKHEGYKCVTMDGSAYDFALALARLQRHIKTLQNK